MNGINNMGGKEINALGERFMFKYDPMGENGKRRNQVMARGRNRSRATVRRSIWI